MKLALVLLIGSVALAQNAPVPDVANAHFETRPYSGDLAAQLRATEPTWFGPTWFGYAVTGMRHNDQHWCNECQLEQSSNTSAVRASSTHRIALEGTDVLAILFRVENNSIGRIRVNSIDCPLDAGGRPFVWISGVPAAASLSLLEHLATGSADHLQDAATFAISQHENPAAITLLERLASPPQPTHTRGQAIFWLAQRAGEKAASFITNTIRNDPDTEVKTKAVFALSQLPRDEGVPRLIEVARSNNNREVRKQAFFWLGQSQDPRALAFIEQILAP